MLKCVCLVDLRHRASFGGILLRSFLDDFKSDIDVCNVNNVEKLAINVVSYTASGGATKRHTHKQSLRIALE